MGQHQYADAAEAFRKALELNPKHAEAGLRIRQAQLALAREGGQR
jgi:cytochrome c-type biogenesis protein CcmH/NrfG